MFIHSVRCAVFCNRYTEGLRKQREYINEGGFIAVACKLSVLSEKRIILLPPLPSELHQPPLSASPSSLRLFRRVWKTFRWQPGRDKPFIYFEKLHHQHTRLENYFNCSSPGGRYGGNFWPGNDDV